LKLAEHFANLFDIIEREFPQEYLEIVSLAGRNRALLTDGKESVIFFVEGNKLAVSPLVSGSSHHKNEIEEGRLGGHEVGIQPLPGGKFDKKTVIELLDGQMTLNEAVRAGSIDCKGKESDVILFFEILRIVLFVSARSPRAYKLWKDFKDDDNDSNHL
jgi:hypothetical protein